MGMLQLPLAGVLAGEAGNPSPAAGQRRHSRAGISAVFQLGGCWGLRAPDEFVRHKLVDAVGDLALAGAVLRGRFIAHRSGHALNNQLLRALFADADAWREAANVPLPVAA